MLEHPLETSPEGAALLGPGDRSKHRLTRRLPNLFVAAVISLGRSLRKTLAPFRHGQLVGGPSVCAYDQVTRSSLL